MPRIRTIKPEFWSDEKLARLPDQTRMLFLALLSMADDAGRILDNVKQIEAFVWPFSDADTFAAHVESIVESLDELAAIGRIQRGSTASGQKVIQITNWKRHQKIDRPNLVGALPEIVAPQAFDDSSNRSPSDSSNGSANHSRPDLGSGIRDQGSGTLPPSAAVADAPGEPPRVGDAGHTPDRDEPPPTPGSMRWVQQCVPAEWPPNWVDEWVRLWREVVRGLLPHGRAGKVGKPARDVYAPRQVAEAMADYRAHCSSRSRDPRVEDFVAALPRLVDWQALRHVDEFGTDTARGEYILGRRSA